MKKYNNFDTHMVLLGIVIPFLVFFISLNTTFAYFTATATKKESSTETAIVKISFDAVEANAVTTTQETSSTTILPGDTLTVVAEVNNSGTADCYIVIEFELKVRKTSGLTQTPVKKYYTIVNNSLAEITKTTTGYSRNVDIIDAKTVEEVEFPSYTFTGANYDNSYKNATVFYTLRANAIQTLNIPGGAAEATEILMGNIGIDNTLVYGNSVQNGTPSPTNPAEIQSVGERTKNLFNVNNLVAKDQNVVNNNNGTISVTPTSGSSGVSTDQTLATFAPSLQVGKTYTLSFNTTGQVNYIYLMTSASTWGNGNSRTITQNDLDSRVYWYANGTDTTFTAIISNIQIEEGSTATEYEPYGKYKIPVTVETKNLIDVSDLSKWEKGHANLVLSSTHNSITAPVIEHAVGYAMYTEHLMPDTYTISGTASSGANRIVVKCYNSSGDLISGSSSGYWSYNSYYQGWNYVKSGDLNVSITVPESVAYWQIGLVFYDSNDNAGSDYTWSNFQLELGSTATEYEPYIGTYNIYLDEPLRKVGDVADYIDLETGTVVRNVKEMIFTGAENFWLYSYNDEGISFSVDISDKKIGFSTSVCSHFQNVQRSWGVSYKNELGIYTDHNLQTNQYYRAPTSSITTIEQFKAWVKEQYENGNPVCMQYILATPDTSETFDEVVSIPNGATITIGTTIAPSTN